MNPLDMITGVPTSDARSTLGNPDPDDVIELPVTLGPWPCDCELRYIEDPLAHSAGNASHFEWVNRCAAHTPKTTIVFVPCDGVQIHVTPHRGSA